MATKQRRLHRPDVVRDRKTRALHQQYRVFSALKDRKEIAGLNQKIVDAGIREEQEIADGLKESGELRDGNGFEMFLAAGRRRLSRHDWDLRIGHSGRVARYSRCIAEAMVADPGQMMIAEMIADPEQARKAKEERQKMLDTILRIIRGAAGVHDIGKTLLAQSLLDKERISEEVTGERTPITRDELSVVQISHVEAGVSLVEIYSPFMTERERELTACIVGGHHMAYNGIGSASGRGYSPKQLYMPTDMENASVGEDLEKVRLVQMGVGAHMKGGNVPTVADIMRCADVLAALAENRYYRKESSSIVDSVEGMTREDAALGALISVAGTDVDPKMVRYLIMGMYGVDQERADAIVLALACREKSMLETRGGDISYAIKSVLPDPSFMDLIRLKTRLWSAPNFLGAPA